MAVILEGKVKEGDCIKNYKELCKILDLPVLGGCSKVSQLKELKRYLDYEKDGQKFIITEIYDTPLKKDDKRSYGNNKKYEHSNFIIPDKYKNCIGVYKIQKEFKIYIGSTCMGFKKRFIGHLKGELKHTKELLDSGAIFDYLWIAPNNCSNEKIRNMEKFYYDRYSNLNEYEVINKNDIFVSTQYKKKNNNKKNKKEKMEKVILYFPKNKRQLFMKLLIEMIRKYEEEKDKGENDD